MGWPPVLCLEALSHTPMVVHIRAAMPGTHSGGYAWYIYGRLRLVHIRAIMPGTHSGGYAWYILARSMTECSGKPRKWMSVAFYELRLHLIQSTNPQHFFFTYGLVGGLTSGLKCLILFMVSISIIIISIRII